MQKLDWEFIESRSGGYQRASYRGLVIEARQDCDASNPFESWDCEPPTLVYSGGRNGSRSDYSDGACETALDSIPDGKFRRHWRAIAEALDLKPTIEGRGVSRVQPCGALQDERVEAKARVE